MNSLRKMWDDTKHINILIMGITGEKGDKKAEKHIWRNMVEKCPKFDEKHQVTDLKNLVKPKQDKNKKIQTQIYHNPSVESPR